MAGSRSQVNKAHKSRFASKASRHVHRTSGSDKNRIAKPDHRNSVKGGRAARVQRSKMARDQKRAALLKERRAQGGSLSSPRVIVLFGLSSCVNLNLFSRDFLHLLSGGEADGTSNTVALPGCKLRATVYTAPYGDLLSCMELCKVADLVAFVVSSNSFIDGCEAGNPIDPFGTQCLSVFRAIGLPSTAVFIQDLPNDVKRKQDLKKTIISCLASELPEECKFYPADTKEELHKFMWLFKEQHLSAPHWRSQRSYLMSQQVVLEPDDSNPGQCTLLMSGYVQAHSLSVNQLVHVSGAGDFQLSKIDILKDPFPTNGKKDHNAMDSDDKIGLQAIHTLLPDPLSHEPLLVENAPDPLAGEQTWPTEAEIAEADANSNRHKLKKKKLPRGTSDYQAAWIVDDTDDEVSDDADDGDGMVLDEQQKDHTVLEGSDYSDVDEGSHDMVEETEIGEEMDDDEKLTKEQIEAEIKKIKDANAEDEEFPDEVDTPLDVPAKKRFAKYRGLKSFRTSSWDPKESLPPEYARIFAFDNFTRTQKHVLAKLKDEGNINEYASVGSFVRLHIKNVPVDVASKACVQSQKLPVVAYSLLQHESKMSVLHFSIRKHDSYEQPIKSKDTLIFHVGFRKFLARPVFSSDNINCDKHKMERFLHEGRFSIASVYAPICYPPLPLIVMRCAHGEAPTVVATGSLKSVDPDRIVLKKIILTGYPQRVSKLKAIVRFMFHNPEDVRWFKPVDVWTKLGRRGRIKEPVGTHGATKCVFNGVIQQHDTVCMSLYKRAYPKWPERLYAV
ncbi:pre-rRNA-processing protein TSR1 homolog [Dioscorea cayenensis subsp. rotundata]|uniref:Pre-rRNA-processing protein TSR1 homolog n=1 Tax=Dioscorea cayennensis subsp. rotundata TaxID=55577 RepID=A0AB40CEF3_DIOCR|nr:pre-rRNA-processing protein TSR1 homolog [Dioscorea cayenensis subsp. rotundata]